MANKPISMDSMLLYLLQQFLNPMPVKCDIKQPDFDIRMDENTLTFVNHVKCE